MHSITLKKVLGIDIIKRWQYAVKPYSNECCLISGMGDQKIVLSQG